MNKDIKKAIDKVFIDLSALSQEEFKKVLDEHTPSDMFGIFNENLKKEKAKRLNLNKLNNDIKREIDEARVLLSGIEFDRGITKAIKSYEKALSLSSQMAKFETKYKECRIEYKISVSTIKRLKQAIRNKDLALDSYQHELKNLEQTHISKERVEEIINESILSMHPCGNKDYKKELINKIDETLQEENHGIKI